MKELKLIELEGKTAFLNGQPGLHKMDRVLHDMLESLGKNVIILDNLFGPKGREGLYKLITEDIDNIVLHTTGIHSIELKTLVNIFEMFDQEYGWRPKRVITIDETTTMVFLSVFREFKEKGVEFWTLYEDDSIIEIEWV
jgi:hypothetical protein